MVYSSSIDPQLGSVVYKSLTQYNTHAHSFTQIEADFIDTRKTHLILFVVCINSV